MGVSIAKKSRKLKKKPQSPTLPSPNPRRLMDPDLQNASEALD